MPLAFGHSAFTVYIASEEEGSALAIGNDDCPEDQHLLWCILRCQSAVFLLVAHILGQDAQLPTLSVL